MSEPAYWDGGLLKQARGPKGNKPKTTLKASEAQRIRTAFLSGVRAERIALSIEQFAFAKCLLCHQKYEDFFSAWAGLDLHHVKKRSKGHGYKGGQDFGVDDPHNLQLLCRPCHRKEEEK